MTTITQVISTAPTAPSWQRPDDFAEEADVFVLYLSGLDTELNTAFGQVNTVADEINTNVETATTQAGIAITQAGIATTQAELAATQAELATTNGATQVTLAEAQVALATTQAGNALASANNAAASYDAFDDRYLGNKESNPSTDNDGNTLLVGALYFNTSLDQMKIWNGTTWLTAYLSEEGYQETLISGINIKTINSNSILEAGNILILSYYTYDNRADLRSLTPNNNDTAIIDGLGLFVFKAGSDEPDDDESCFATATGRWLLEAAHWDVVDAWQLPDDNIRDENIEDIQNIASSYFTKSNILYGTATCAITSLNSNTSTAFTGTITGATVGDRVYVNPPAALGTDNNHTSRLSLHAYISATNTVTIQLCNPSATTANVNSAVQAAWKVIVIKE